MNDLSLDGPERSEGPVEKVEAGAAFGSFRKGGGFRPSACPLSETDSPLSVCFLAYSTARFLILFSRSSVTPRFPSGRRDSAAPAAPQERTEQNSHCHFCLASSEACQLSQPQPPLRLVQALRRTHARHGVIQMSHHTTPLAPRKH